jgi:hypothetical protein
MSVQASSSPPRQQQAQVLVRPPLEIFKWYTKNGYPPKTAPVFNAHARPLESAEGTHKIQGDRFTGKSALGEVICYLYFITGGTVYDLYAANDNEALAWLDSPYAANVVLLVGSNCSLQFEKTRYKFMRAIDLDPKTAPAQRIYVACRAFFESEEDYYLALWDLSKKFKTRVAYDRVDVIFMREAQEVVQSVQVATHKNQKDAMTVFKEFHNTLFHFGYAVVLDSQRDVEVAKSIRELSDWNYLKNMGGMEIPRKFWHTFRKVDPDRVYREMDRWHFVIYTKGKLGLGRFLKPDWHAERGVDIMARLGLKPVFSGEPTQIIPSRPSATGNTNSRGRPANLVMHQKVKELLTSVNPLTQKKWTYNEIIAEVHVSDRTIAIIKKQLEADARSKAAQAPASKSQR